MLACICSRFLLNPWVEIHFVSLLFLASNHLLSILVFWQFFDSDLFYSVELLMWSFILKSRPIDNQLLNRLCCAFLFC